MRKIQIWSNSHGNEFAIRLDTDIDFRAVTNPDETYEKIVDESPYLEDMHYDWNYTLGWWINGNNGNGKIGSEPTKMLKPSFHLGSLNGDDNNSDANVMIARKSSNGRGGHIKKSKPNLKCHYCGLMFTGQEARSDHEKAWHANKRLK
jgi:hypothetical protein